MSNNKYHIITIGCQMNKSDSERIAAYLEGLGYMQTDDRSQIDLAVITTCGVRQSAEDRIYGLVPSLKRSNPRVKIIITGCLAGRPDVQRRLKGRVDIFLPITELPMLADKLGLAQTEAGSLSGYLAVKPKLESLISAFVPIGNGCDNFCTYCVVPNARGRETYRPATEILAEVRDLVKRGYKEITLIAQNVNSYKSAEGVDFVELVKQANDVPGNFWLRYATNHPKDMSDNLIEATANLDKVCHHIHLPVQAGDDEVLARMNRKYTNAHYRQLIEKIRTAMPDVSITTDIIVGFPGESAEQFARTAELARWARYDNIFIGKYSQRPKTAAAQLTDDVSKDEKKRREDALFEILKETAAANHRRWCGRTLEVLVESQAKGHYYGRTRDNTSVKIVTDNPPSDLLGRFVNVKIIDARDFGMDGVLLEV